VANRDVLGYMNVNSNKCGGWSISRTRARKQLDKVKLSNMKARNFINKIEKMWMYVSMGATITTKLGWMW